MEHQRAERVICCMGGDLGAERIHDVMRKTTRANISEPYQPVNRLSYAYDAHVLACSVFCEVDLLEHLHQRREPLVNHYPPEVLQVLQPSQNQATPRPGLPGRVHGVYLDCQLGRPRTGDRNLNQKYSREVYRLRSSWPMLLLVYIVMSLQTLTYF